ncbi:CPBP family intramembrane glutamic endopeptidase [Rothia sp. ZJ1223]|uniref:CPBP family intramembrane glutamic endopeptidase n=1 Tax=Rothia sp. ZJ1223 TaxID=2811098 RepID=UPI001955F5DE|nr:CPBP family intramembrane glutamic endopeptidase [Rothia sp. ZJ1223]MBM7052101.1 CPBP family intramembrane metalloprotease [Rothia sp. ZJ1223]
MSSNPDHVPWAQDSAATNGAAAQPPGAPPTTGNYGVPAAVVPGANAPYPPVGYNGQLPPNAPHPGQYPAFARPYNPRPLPHHRLAFADPKNAWWKPLVEGAIGLGIFLALQTLLTVPLVAAIFMVPDFPSLFSETDPSKAMEAFTTAAFENPWVFAYLFASIAVMFPSMWLARLIIGPKPWGLVHSVAGRLRWGWMLLCGGIAALIFLLVPLAITPFMGGAEATEPWREQASPLWIYLVLLITLVPIQCYAEELIFRGYLMQTIGRWLKHPAWAIILPAPLFMLGHGYDLWGQLSVLCMGLTAGFLVWYTGGLEAAIALHVINNVLAMFSGLMGTVDPFANAGSTPADFFTVFAMELIFAGAVVFAARKRKIQRVRPAADQQPVIGS